MAVPNFTAGQVLDVASLNSLVSEINTSRADIDVNATYPKVMHMDIGVGGASSGAAGSNVNMNILNLRGDIIGTLVDSKTLRLTPGEYSLEFFGTAHSGGWDYWYLRANGVDIDSSSSYDNGTSMNNGHCRAKRTFTVNTDITFYFAGVNSYTAKATVRKLREI